MKYRRLSIDELKSLETEFVRFLAANSITADDWKRLLDDEKGDAAKVETLLEQFSDLVLDRALTNIVVVEQRSPTDWRMFRYGPTEALMIALHSTAVALDEGDLRDILLDIMAGKPAEVQMLTKTYLKSREEELYALMQAGATVSTEALFEVFKKFAEHR